MPQIRPLAALGPVVLLAIAWTALAQDDVVDLEVGAKDRVRGTLRPAEDNESFRVQATAGAVLKVTLKGVGSVAPPASVSVLDPGDVEIGSAADAGVARVTTAPLAATGLHRIRVLGDGENDGDFDLKVKVKHQRRFDADDGSEVPAGAAGQFTFSAPAGAIPVVLLKPAGGSAFLPVIESITGPAQDEQLFDPSGATERKHKVTGGPLPATGDYVVHFRNAGAAGAYVGRVTLRLPTLARRTFDIRDAALAGEYGGTQGVYGRLVDDGGATLVPPDSATNLAATQIDIPGDALDVPLIVSFAQDEAFFVDDDNAAAGPAVEFAPSGLTFDNPVTITLPYVPNSVDDVSELRIHVLDPDTGLLEVVPGPYVVDTVNNTVSFPALHFSTFQATSAGPRPVKGTFAEFLVRARVGDAFEGEFTVGHSNFAAGTFKGRSGNPLVRNRSRRSVNWRVSPQAGAVLSTTLDEGTDNGQITILDDESVTVDAGSESLTYRRGRSPDVLLSSRAQDGELTLSLVVRRTPGRPTLSNLVGTYHAFTLELNASSQPQGIDFIVVGTNLLLTVGPDGRVVAGNVTRGLGRATFPGGQWSFTTTKTAPKPGRVSPLKSDKAVQLDMQLGFGPNLDQVKLFPLLAGDLLLGVSEFAVDGGSAGAARGAVRIVVLVRASEGAAVSDFDGRSLFGALGVLTDPGSADGSIRFDLQTGRVVHDAAGGLDLSAVRELRGHLLATGGATVEQTLLDETGTYRVGGNGTFRESTPLERGALTRRRALYVGSKFREGRYVLGFGLPARPGN